MSVTSSVVAGLSRALPGVVPTFVGIVGRVAPGFQMAMRPGPVGTSGGASALWRGPTGRWSNQAGAISAEFTWPMAAAIAAVFLSFSIFVVAMSYSQRRANTDCTKRTE